MNENPLLGGDNLGDQDFMNYVTIVSGEQPDGGTSLRFTISIDPEVRKEKAKALKKGEKREDLVDDLEEQGEKDEGKAVQDTQDDAPKGVFAVALDALADGDSLAEAEYAEDGSPQSVHKKTPIEACRAKDKRFCPYHGHLAIADYLKSVIASEMTNAGFPKTASDLDQDGWDVAVAKDDNGKNYKVEIRFPPQYGTNLQNTCNTSAVKSVMKLGSTNGISIVPLPSKQSLTADIEAQVRVEGQDQAKALLESVDDLMCDLARDPAALNDLEPSDVADLLDSAGDLDIAKQAAEADPTNSSKRGVVQMAYQPLREKYGVVRSIVDLREDYGTLAAVTGEALKLSSSAKKCDGDYRTKKGEIDTIKKVFWPTGRFPNGFARENTFVDAYNRASQNAGHFARTDVDDARIAYDGAFAVLPPNQVLTKADKKAILPKLGNLQWKTSVYERSVDDYYKAAEQFKKDLYDYVTGQNPKTGAIRYAPSIVSRAFPTGRPQ